jgi:hypothetical protein
LKSNRTDARITNLVSKVKTQLSSGHQFCKAKESIESNSIRISSSLNKGKVLKLPLIYQLTQSQTDVQFVSQSQSQYNDAIQYTNLHDTKYLFPLALLNVDV